VIPSLTITLPVDCVDVMEILKGLVENDENAESSRVPTVQDNLGHGEMFVIPC